MNGNPPLHLWLIPLLPFIGFLLNGLLGRHLPKNLVTAIALFFTAAPLAKVAEIVLRFSSLKLPYVEQLGPWVSTSTFQANFAFLLDPLTLVMLLVVTGVGFLIHLYSAGYMAHEEGYWRYFAYLNLFMFFMLTLVLAENFLLMFVGWEGVGLASYLLIGFYFMRQSAVDAGKKAFILNRIGDFGFLLAMFLMIAHFGSTSFSTVFSAIAQHPQMQGGFLTAIALLLVLGATGKSAQIPLYVWLPDAMEGPTPVSALIHAATMVTAGVYMIVRSHALFDRSPFALGVVAVIGAATALFAATVGIVQTDIKRVLAYSTISQLGYMFLACGAAAYSAAIFHLVTHAFFKGLLFLAAGSVIHALGGEQDMRAMGGLRKEIPITFWTMSAAVFAISGLPPFSGFFSKDAILYQAFLSPTAGPILWFVGLVTALLTAFYMFRLWYLTFFGASRAEAGHTAHPHESPRVMLIPLILLAVLSVAGGWIGIPQALGGGDHFAHFLEPVVNTAAVPSSATNPNLVTHPDLSSRLSRPAVGPEWPSAFGPPMVMKIGQSSASLYATSLFTHATDLRFVIPTGARRSGGTCVAPPTFRGHDFRPREVEWSDPRCAPVFKESRMISAKTINIDRKSGGSVVEGPAVPSPSGSENQERLFSVISVVMAGIGWFLADLLYRRKPGLADKLAERAGGGYRLLVNKYWIDQLYNTVIVTPLLFLTRYLLWAGVDRGVITGGASLAAGSARGVGALVQRVQSGNIRSYAGWLAIGAAAVLLITYFGFSIHL